MSIKSVEYLPYSNFLYNLIGKTEKRIQIAQIGSILVFEVIYTWICLKCCHRQDQHVYNREVGEN